MDLHATGLSCSSSGFSSSVYGPQEHMVLIRHDLLIYDAYKFTPPPFSFLFLCQIVNVEKIQIVVDLINGSDNS